MTWTVIGTLGGLIVVMFSLQTTWIIHSLGMMNQRFDRMDARFDRADARFDRMDARFDRLEHLLTNHGERITRVEERAQQ